MTGARNGERPESEVNGAHARARRVGRASCVYLVTSPLPSLATQANLVAVIFTSGKRFVKVVKTCTFNGPAHFLNEENCYRKHIY